MNSAEKQRIEAAYERAGLMAALANRGFYVIGEVWRDRICGRPARPDAPLEAPALAGEDQPRPDLRNLEPDPATRE